MSTPDQTRPPHPAEEPVPGTAGPAAGLRVVDLSTTTAGAICTMMLAEQGATVVMIEPVDGHPLRRLPVGRVWLRGKRSVRAAGVALDRLYEQADVVVTGSPDGAPPVYAVPDLQRFPRVVLCESGGPLGPFPGDADLVTAATGIMAHQPGFRGGPVYVVPPLVAVPAALLALQGIGAALFARERSGQGDRVQVPLLFGSLAQQIAYLVQTERPSPLEALRRNAYGQLPLYRLYQCRDSRWLHLGLINARFWPRLCVAIERPELLSDPRFERPVRFGSHEARRSLMDIIGTVIAQRPYDEWDRIFDEHDVPCSPALTADELAQDPQTIFRQGVVQVSGPDGEERQPGLALHFEHGPRRPASAMPAPGEHDADPWGAAARTERPVAPAPAAPAPSIPPATAEGGAQRTAEARGPLVGVRILDLSGYIAGALGPAFLADLGADVIKIEGPDGDGLRGLHAGFIAWNRGKRGLCVDLRTEEGQAIVHRLARDADVVLDNMRPGVAARLGVDYPTLSAINPRLVYGYVSAYGSDGPYRHKPGVDPLLQARSGIERVQGGHEHPPVFLLLAVTDNTCAMLNAAGITLGLQQRERTGRGLYFETSLLQAAILLQSDPLLDYPGRPPSHVNDYDETGPGPLRRLYRCGDGWLFLAAVEPGAEPSPELIQTLFTALGRPVPAADPRFQTPQQLALYQHDLADELEAAFAALPLAGALQALRGAGIPAADATERYTERFPRDLAAADPALVVQIQHTLMGTVTAPGVLVRLERNPGLVQRSAPLLGQHTPEILAVAGYDAATVERLRASGVISWGEER